MGNRHLKKDSDLYLNNSITDTWHSLKHSLLIFIFTASRHEETQYAQISVPMYYLHQQRTLPELRNTDIIELAPDGESQQVLKLLWTAIPDVALPAA